MRNVMVTVLTGSTLRPRRPGIRRLAFPAITVATVLAMTLSGPVLAATWSEPITIVGSGPETHYQYRAWPFGLVGLDDGTVVAAYSESPGGTGAVDLYVRRSIDGGLSWAPRVRVSRLGTDRQSWPGGVAAYGTSVDVAWDEANNVGNQIRYARSTDGGLTFSKSVALSQRGDNAYPQVARGPDGLVAVVWNNWKRGKISARISHDGGATFGPRQTLGSAPKAWVVPVGVAIGDGMIYLAYGDGDNTVWLRRSVDGAAWTPKQPIVATAPFGFQLVAEGHEAYLGYVRDGADGLKAMYRRTTDVGATWSLSSKMGAVSGDSYGPVMSLRHGVARVLLGRSTPSNAQEVFYRESADGVNWTTAELVSSTPGNYAYPFGIGYSDRPIVGYMYWAPINYNGDVQVRVGTL